MKPEYLAWILANYPTKLSALAQCQTATLKMVEAFPELLRERGHVTLLGEEGTRAHWWCHTSVGIIIDPTAHQWDAAITSYEKFVPCPIRGEPIGKCMNCGELCWSKDPDASQHACCKECEDAIMSDF